MKKEEQFRLGIVQFIGAAMVLLVAVGSNTNGLFMGVIAGFLGAFAGLTLAGRITYKKKEE